MICTPLQTWLLINTGSGQQTWSNKIVQIQWQQGLQYLSNFVFVFVLQQNRTKKHKIAAGDLV
jgi:hypothetical protein